MNLNQKQLITIGAVIFAALLFNWGLNNPAAFAHLAAGIGAIIKPFIIGAALAFIINIPMQLIEARLPAHPRFAKMRRPLAWLIAVILLMGAITLAVDIVIPQLIDTLQIVSARALQSFRDADSADILPDFVTVLLPELDQILRDLGLNLSDFTERLAQGLENLNRLFNTGFNLVNAIISTVVSVFVGFFFSVYLLFDKERLARQGKQVLFALLKPAHAERVVAILRLSCDTFRSFICVQCLEACILALLFFVSMCLLRLPYATLISAVIGFSALIPVFGAFIGCLFGCLLLLLNSPLQLVEFIVLFIVLQQIEGNLIYPRVVGGKVGLPAIWVLVAITVGGALFGVPGMLVFIPLCSIAYSLFASFIKERLKSRQIPPEKWQ